MKAVLSYMLLIVYTTLLVKPVLPFFIDAAQHIFNYQEHMTVVHFENGQYHVHYELNDNAKKDIPHKDATNTKKDISQDEYIIQNELKTTPVVYKIALHRLILSSNLASTHLVNDYPPPKV